MCVAKDDTDWHDDDEDGEGVTRLGRSPEPAHVKQELDGHEDWIVEVNLLKKREPYYMIIFKYHVHNGSTECTVSYFEKLKKSSED